MLEDVVRVMFDEKFIAELFKRQPVYPQSSTREIFYKVAHSSIMRLSESSMEKVLSSFLLDIAVVPLSEREKERERESARVCVDTLSR